ncbi:hypothetical protein P9112_004501 [Eukaryota sp. TZLM1-RC]
MIHANFILPVHFFLLHFHHVIVLHTLFSLQIFNKKLKKFKKSKNQKINSTPFKPQFRSLRSAARSVNNSVSAKLFSPSKIRTTAKTTANDNHGSNNRKIFRTPTSNSAVDKIEMTEKMKPMPLKTGKVHSQSCGKCRQPRHNVKACSQIKQEQLKARAASADLKQSLSSLPINDDNADQEIPAIVPVNSSNDSPNNKCIFCTQNLGINSSGRTLRFCESCKGRYGSAKQCLFSSELAECNENTIAQLNSLHPVGNFKCPKPNNVSYWEQNPLTNDELFKLINHLPSGKAPSPSMITFDMLKSTVNQCPECIDDLVFFFNKILTLNIKLPSEMTISRLIALKKNESKIRPTAIGESLSRILASAVFGRIGKKAKDFFSPFQFGIKTIDGASSAALSSDVYFNSNTSNYIFNLDFKNAFNAVKRSSILLLLQTHFPEAESFFYNFYGSQSTLVYEEFNLISSSGVKQGDPLGPFFFCLAIHPLMCELKQEFPDVHITAYMDDISLIGPIDSLRTIAEIVQQRYYQIGLSLNIFKCLLLGREPADFIIDDQSVPFIN